MPNPSIQNVSIFGSATRNDLDELSDLDVLALVVDGGGTVAEQDILSLLPPESRPIASISWYGFRKMSAMFQSGHLFAWHLFTESRPIGGSEHIAKVMGRPANYQIALDDIDGLVDLLNSAKAQLLKGSPNLIYELGLLYLSARNIAMSASWHLLSTTQFGRYSPFAITNPEFPIRLEEYKILTNCRMASQRGISFSTDMEYSRAIVICDELLKWSAKVRKKVEIEQRCT